ncbi:MAG: P-II family nitrogen regulator [Acetobacteraceae bacterium]|nr:P-II family nitrogen regulator [Acetobacteraceae bacterium]
MSTDPSLTLITAFIKPQMEGRVVRTLHDLSPFPGISLIDIRGQGRGRGAGGAYTATEYDFNYHSHLQLQMVCSTEAAPEICRMIARAAWTGQKGDGAIYTTEVSSYMRIREAGGPEYEEFR